MPGRAVRVSVTRSDASRWWCRVPTEPSLLARSGRMFRQSGPLAAICASVVMAIYYGGLLTGFHYDLFLPVEHGLTFNSMLHDLLLGQFDVDPKVVTDEGFLRD